MDLGIVRDECGVIQGLCEQCQHISTAGNPVTLNPCPYNQDVNGDNTPVWLCSDCRQQCADDI